MKVLHVVPALGARTGGPAVSVVESSLAVRELGIETTIATTDLRGTASSRTPGRISAEELPDGAGELDVRLYAATAPRRLVFSPALDRALAREIGGYDVVHIHSLFLFPQFSAYRHAARHGVPWIVSPRGALDPWLRRRGRVRKALTEALWQRRMLQRAAALHLTSTEEARLVADVAPRVPRVVVPNGIHWEGFQSLPEPQDFRQTALDGATGPIVLSLGRIAAKKGLDVLVRAFAAAAPGDAVLVLAGPDDEGLVPALQRLASEQGVAERTFFTGMLTGEHKLAALAASDVWALSSHTENFGVAAVEALAAGRAAILSSSVNIAAEAGEAGAALVRPPEPAAFAEAIGSLLSDAEERAQLGERAREFARRYDWRAVAPSLARMYADVASGAVHSPRSTSQAVHR